MGKLDLQFATFAGAVTEKGFTPVQQGNSVYYIKSAKGGKVEVNTHSGTYTVGSGLKSEITDNIVKVAIEKGFTLVKRPAGWAVLNFIDMDRFFDLIEIVDSTIPEKASKETKAKADKPTTPTVVGSTTTEEKSPAEIEAMKADRIEQMKQIAAKLKQAKKSKKGDEPASEAQEPTPMADSFQAPESLSPDEVAAMV